MAYSEHDILIYSKLAEGADFFLHEAFRAIHVALSDDYASVLFAERLKSIEPTDEDRALSENATFPTETIAFLRHSDNDAGLSEATIGNMSKAWQECLAASRANSFHFPKKHVIESIQILGHFNNLGFFFESIVNRHLLFFRQTGRMDNFSYNQLSKSKILERLVYIFKERLSNGEIQLNEISNLFKLRNKTVHFTPDNALALKPKMSEVMNIWKQVEDVLKLFEADERFSETPFSARIATLAIEVEAQWT